MRGRNEQRLADADLVLRHAVELLNLAHADAMRGGDAEERVAGPGHIRRVSSEVGAAVVAGARAFAPTFDAAHIALQFTQSDVLHLVAVAELCHLAAQVAGGAIDFRRRWACGGFF